MKVGNNLREVIELETLDESKRLKLSFTDKYSCKIEMYSKGYSYSGNFTFDNLGEFSLNLESMVTSLEGNAELKEAYHDHFIKIQLNKLGHLIVSGLFMEYSPYSQSLSFEFKTDQTCLANFATKIKNVYQNNS